MILKSRIRGIIDNSFSICNQHRRGRDFVSHRPSCIFCIYHVAISLISFFFRICIEGFNAKRLIMVAGILSEQSTAAAISGILCHLKTEGDGAEIIDRKIFNGGPRNPAAAINEGTLGINN